MAVEPMASREALVRMLMIVFFGLLLSNALVQALSRLPRWEAWEAREQGAMVLRMLLFQGLLLGAVAYYVRASGRGWREAFFCGRSTSRAIGWGVAAILVATPLAMMLHYGAHLLFEWIDRRPVVQEAIQMIRRPDTPVWMLGFQALSAVVLAPLAEELVYRGVVLQAIREIGRGRLALWVSSILFALSHGNAVLFIPLLFLGLVFAWLFVRTGNLASSIAAHAVFNAIQFGYTLLKFRG